MLLVFGLPSRSTTRLFLVFDTSRLSSEPGSKVPIVYYTPQAICAHAFQVDKLEQMLGSYGPQKDAYTKNFDSDEAPSGMLARSGSYNVKSRVVDDDGEVYAGTCSLPPSFHDQNLSVFF